MCKSASPNRHFGVGQVYLRSSSYSSKGLAFLWERCLQSLSFWVFGNQILLFSAIFFIPKDLHKKKLPKIHPKFHHFLADDRMIESWIMELTRGKNQHLEPTVKEELQQEVGNFSVPLLLPPKRCEDYLNILWLSHRIHVWKNLPKFTIHQCKKM